MHILYMNVITVKPIGKNPIGASKAMIKTPNVINSRRLYGLVAVIVCFISDLVVVIYTSESLTQFE